MRRRHSGRRFKSARLLIVAGLALAATALAAVASAGAASGSGDFLYVANPPRVQVTSATTPQAFTNPFCTRRNGVPQLLCYSPDDLKTAYDFPSSLDGSGQTIVIVDAFGSPTIQQDLANFDAQFGLPAPPSFQVVCPQGCPSFNPNSSNQVGWAFETSLDVEWAHALAPGANIVLVVASTNFGSSINNAEASAFAQFPNSIVSQSFGFSETGLVGNQGQIQQSEQNYQAAVNAGITLLASAGDDGATNGGSTESALYPSSNPFTTAVGGTQGHPYYNGLAGSPLPSCASQVNKPCTIGLATIKCTTSPTFSPTAVCPTIGYGDEEVWNEPFFGLATGGAESLLYSAPSYQSGVNGSTQRTTPDISLDAAISGGVLVTISFPGAAPGFYIVGGTSASSPEWAAIVALANQARGLQGKGNLGFLNPTLYAIAQSKAYKSDFHDITFGNNQLTGTPFGYSAGTGYDIASGWGTPDVSNLVGDLAK